MDISSPTPALCNDVSLCVTTGNTTYSIDKNSDLGDMYFNMTNYVGDTLKVFMIPNLLLNVWSHIIHCLQINHS